MRGATLELVGCLAAWVCTSSACMLLEESEQHEAAERTAEIDPADYAEQVDSKLRRFSACRDVLASIMLENRDRYLDQVGDDGRPKHLRDGVYLRPLGDNVFRSCRRVIEAAKAPPRMDVLEDLLIRSVDAASRHAELTRELGRYLDGEGWREDDWATLERLDARLRISHSHWLAADQELQKAIDVRHIENDSILLGVLEQRRSPLEVASRKLMIRTRPWVRCVTNPELESINSCRPLYEGFEQAADDFERLYGAQREAADRVFWMAAFAHDVEEFRGIASDLVRNGGRRPKPGDLQPLTDAYSSLVRDAETLDFDFP